MSWVAALESRCAHLEDAATHILLGHDALLGGPLEGGNAGVLDLVQVLHALGDVRQQVGARRVGAKAPGGTRMGAQSELPTVRNWTCCTQDTVKSFQAAAFPSEQPSTTDFYSKQSLAVLANPTCEKRTPACPALHAEHLRKLQDGRRFSVITFTLGQARTRSSWPGPCPSRTPRPGSWSGSWGRRAGLPAPRLSPPPGRPQ